MHAHLRSTSSVWSTIHFCGSIASGHRCISRGQYDAYLVHLVFLPLAAGEPELAVAPHVLKAPVHVYTPGRPFKRLTAYGDTYGESAPPVCVLFYGQHYDALVDLDKKPGAARSRGPSSRKRSRDTLSDHLSGQNF
jgi:hypothetical protein